MTETTHDGYLVDGRRLRAHPAAECFPLMTDVELEALAADIGTNGCRVPVSICGDLLLDGRNRALACERAGVPVPWETLPAVGARDASLVVTSLNLQRRHMAESQRALAAAKLANLGAGRPAAAGTAEPAAQADGTADSGQGRLARPNGETAPVGAVSREGAPVGAVSREGAPVGAVSREGAPVGAVSREGAPVGAVSREGAPVGAVSQKTAAELMNVSRRSTQRAAAIKNDPDLAPAVERGQVTVADAYRVRDEPAEVKRRAVETVEAGEAPTLAGAVKRIKQEEAREQAIAEATNTAAVPNLLTAPVGELEAAVGPASVDIIATMPPSARGSVESGVYGDLGRFAAHALRPGGVLLTRAASAHLPKVLQQLAVEGLEYRWIVACYEPDGRRRINARKVTTSWRPWLVYTRSGERPDRNSADYLAAADGEAAQTATAIEAMVREWAAPGWALFDPFCGAGTVLVAARRAGLHVGGADADTGNVALARQALENEAGRDEAADLDELVAGPLPRS